MLCSHGHLTNGSYGLNRNTHVPPPELLPAPLPAAADADRGPAVAAVMGEWGLVRPGSLPCTPPAMMTAPRSRASRRRLSSSACRAACVLNLTDWVKGQWRSRLASYSGILRAATLLRGAHVDQRACVSH